MSSRRIVSFLPSATEILFALGLGEQVVGVSHECDFPAATKNKPIVVRPALELATMGLGEIDLAVSARLRSGESLYTVDEALMQSLAPDLIITQNLCQVCATSGNDISQLIQSLPKKPEVLYLTPHSIAEVLDNIWDVGLATNSSAAAAKLLEQCEARLEAVRSRALRSTHRPCVFCCEWVDPVYCSGHWVPEMVGMAGGVDSISPRGSDSVRIPWEQVIAWAPEVLVVTPCGFKLEQAIEQTLLLAAKPGWRDLPAVQHGRVYAVDANSYFARPGPRLVDGVELLAHLFHPNLFKWRGAPDAFQRVET